jgi:hypothetical protein
MSEPLDIAVIALVVALFLMSACIQLKLFRTITRCLLGRKETPAERRKRQQSYYLRRKH